MAAPSPQRLDRWLLLGAGLVLVATTVAAVVRDVAPGWKRVQREALAEVEREVGADVAARLPHGLAQTWMPALGRVDRCVTCHVGVEGGPRLAKLSPVARSHPRPELLKAHPVDEFGCTLCHGGQGFAVDAAAAHGDVEFWDEPVLGRARASRHGVEPAALLETACNACHRWSGAADAMPRIAEAKALVKRHKCVNCHRVDGRGGSTGPDLLYEGDRSPDHLVFPADWRGPRTAFAWHVAHFLDPKRMVPTTEMPDFELTEREATSLALLVTSWRRLSLPPRFTPGSPGGARR